MSFVVRRSLLSCHVGKLYSLRQLSSYKALSYDYCPGETPLVSHTIGQLLEKAVEKNPNRDAFIFTAHKVRYSFFQFLQKA